MRGLDRDPNRHQCVENADRSLDGQREDAGERGFQENRGSGEDIDSPRLMGLGAPRTSARSTMCTYRSTRRRRPVDGGGRGRAEQDRRPAAAHRKRTPLIRFARQQTDPEMHRSVSSDPNPSLECDRRPHRFDYAKRPRSLKESISRTKSTRESKQQDKPVAAVFQGIAHEHCRDGKKAEKAESVHPPAQSTTPVCGVHLPQLSRVEM